MGINELVQTGILSSVELPIAELARLQTLAVGMARYYYKGFGAQIEGLGNFAQNNLLNGPDKERRKILAYEDLSGIETFYANIPFERLAGQPEFEPLFKVRERLPQLRIALDGFYTHPSEENLQKLKDEIQSIIDDGRPYFRLLRNLTGIIRSQSLTSNFYVRISDQHNDYVYWW